MSHPTPIFTLLLLLPLPSPPHQPNPPSPPEHFIHLIHHLLTPTECTQIIAAHQNLIPSNVTPGTKRDRQLFEDEELAERIWQRLKEFYGGDRVKDEDGQWWRASSLNARLRLCRYLPSKCSHTPSHRPWWGFTKRFNDSTLRPILYP